MNCHSAGDNKWRKGGSNNGNEMVKPYSLMFYFDDPNTCTSSKQTDEKQQQQHEQTNKRTNEQVNKNEDNNKKNDDKNERRTNS